MTNKFSMIPEDDKPSPKTIWHRSYTIRLLKNPYAPIVITFFGFILALSCLYLFVRSESWWLKEKIVTVPAIGVRTAKAAELTKSEIAAMSTEQYICYMFGKDCKMALAVSQAENGTRQCDRFNVNTNRTVDYGVFMINTVHLKKGWTVAELIDCRKNVEYAYELFKAQSWNPWVAYKNNSYKKFLR